MSSIDELNDDLLELKKTTGRTVQNLNHKKVCMLKSLCEFLFMSHAYLEREITKLFMQRKKKGVINYCSNSPPFISLSTDRIVYFVDRIG